MPESSTASRTGSRTGPGERTVEAKCHCRRSRGIMAGVGVGKDRPKGHDGTDNRPADGPDAQPADGRPHPSHRGDGYAGTGGGGTSTGGDEAPGGAMIEVRRVGDLTEVEKLIIELEEDLHRQELTPMERSQTSASLADAISVHLREKAETQSSQGPQPTPSEMVNTQTRDSPGPDELLLPAINKSPQRRGREEIPDNQAKVAAEMGMAQPTISALRRHLKAAERYPELGAPDVSHREAFRLYKAWEVMTTTNRSRARKVWNAQKQAKRD